MHEGQIHSFKQKRIQQMCCTFDTKHKVIAFELETTAYLILQSLYLYYTLKNTVVAPNK